MSTETLAQWSDRTNTKIMRHRSRHRNTVGTYVIADACQQHEQRALYSLADYIVSSVSSGVIWLVPR